MQTFYVVPAGTDPTVAYNTYHVRATALTASVLVGDPTGLVTVYPSVAVVSTTNPVALAPAILPDNIGQATLASVQSAQTTCTTAESALASNLTTLQSKANTAITNNTTFLAIGSPTLAQYEAQIVALTKQVDAIIRIMLRLTSSTGGT